MEVVARQALEETRRAVNGRVQPGQEWREGIERSGVDQHRPEPVPASFEQALHHQPPLADEQAPRRERTLVPEKRVVHEARIVRGVDLNRCGHR